MSITGKQGLVSDIPFPSVTICPETKVVSEKLDVISAYNALVKDGRNLSENEWEIEKTLAICIEKAIFGITIRFYFIWLFFL